MACQRCGSERIASVTAKCSDCCSVSVGSYDKDGYVPDDMGIGGGDYVEMDWCLECGQIQGEWPRSESRAEQCKRGACDCGYDKFDEIGECLNCGEHKHLWCPKCEAKIKVYRLAPNSHMVRGACSCIFSIEELKTWNEVWEHDG